jgi:hypothetical protein
MRHAALLLVLALGCGGSGGEGSTFDAGSGGGRDAAAPPGSGADVFIPTFTNDSGQGDTGAGVGTGANGDASGVLAISPSGVTTITVTAGQNTPPVLFTSTLDGVPVTAGWTVSRGDLGIVPPGPSATASFVPSGATGGLVTITAGFNGNTATAQVFIEITAQQNGPNTNNPEEQAQIPTTVGQLTAGGGVGGVGGEGLGGAVTDPSTLTALQSPSSNGSAQGLVFLYPYDKTVWPRGMLAPLLMWDWSVGDADAIQISLATTSGSFSWTGTFSRPAILAAGQPFIRQPIPQDVWDMATNTAGGPTPSGAADELTVSLTVATAAASDASTSEVGFGPITETWPVAPAVLPGVIYYNSYGTQLAQNATGAVGGNGMFGGAVLSIHVGDTGPALVAGSNGGSAQCRTCHSVAAGGSTLVVQHGDDYSASSAYVLTPTGSVENVLTTPSSWFPGVSPDGTLALTGTGQILPLPDDATLPTVTGFTGLTTSTGPAAFSPDGKFAAFNPLAGPGATTPTQQLYVMAFDSPSTTFSMPTLVVDDTGMASATRPGWPAFFPDGQSLVFHHQSAASEDPWDQGNEPNALVTRGGSLAQIVWTSASDAMHVTPLDELNGKDASGNVYLPKLSNVVSVTCNADGAEMGDVDADHSDDVDLNYEPTVLPVAAGGYVWVVFTSRRMYGSEATLPPFCSDPRTIDLVQNVTTKKLWVAAVDLGAAPGTDASHPAFYLPAQELLAGNSRGFWVLEPCRADGQSCQSGDQCCNGYCEPQGDGGALICANAPPNNSCSAVGDKCVSAADCCDPTNRCVNGFCSQSNPQIQ